MRKKVFDGSQGRPDPDGASQMTADSARRPPRVRPAARLFLSPPAAVHEGVVVSTQAARSAVRNTCTHRHTQAQDRKDLLVLVLLR